MNPIKDAKIRLTVMNFLQFFMWGAWLISMGRYFGNVLHFDGAQIGNLFATGGIASIVMPALMGIIADRWVNAERLLGICHALSAVLLITLGSLAPGTPYSTVFGVVLVLNFFYMPTLSLSYTVSYSILNSVGEDVVKAFPAIRVWGTVGFILAMWLVNLLGFMDSPYQFFLGAGVALCLSLYSFTLPKVPHGLGKGQRKGFLSSLGLDALVLLKDKRMAVFFLFSILLGAALQITNAYGNLFLDGFRENPDFENSFAVQYPNILLSLSQISETLFILAIPFFLKRFGIKNVMLLSFFAWFLRFALFSIGDPGFPGIIALLFSMIVYGMAFDFFNISGSMFVDSEAPSSLRASVQGLFILATNGLGAVLGSSLSGLVVLNFTTEAGIEWNTIWAVFAGYALVTGILFLLLFRYKKRPEKGLKQA